MTTNHPISTRILSLFTIIILLFGLVGCNSNDSKGQNGGESTNKEQEATYTADYRWWEENAHSHSSKTSVSYFECEPTEISDKRYLSIFAAEDGNGNIKLSGLLTEKDNGSFREFVVDMSTAEYRDFSVWEDGWLSDGELAYGWHYNFISTSNDFMDYYIHSDGTKSIMITIYDEFQGTEFPIMCSGKYFPTQNPPEESSTPSTDNNTSNNTEIEVDFNVNVDERILVSGTIMSTGNLTIDIGKYCLQLEEPITIQLNDPYFADSSKIYECSVLYFYDDTELIDSSEKSYYLTDDDIGKKCSIFARIEDYRDGGDLYFLYPEIWFD